MSQLPPCSRGRHRARTGCGGSRFCLALEATHVRGWRERCIGQRRHSRRVGRDQTGFTAVPGFQQLRIGQTADQSRMDQPGEVNPRHVTGTGEHAVDIPDRLLRLREMIGQKAAAILLREKSVEPPRIVRKRTDVEEVDHQKVARLRTLDADRTAEEMHDAEVDVAHVSGRFIVLDEPAGPVVALDDEILPRLHRGNHRNVRVPAVVDHVVVVSGLRQVDLDEGVRHSYPRALFREFIGSDCHVARDFFPVKVNPRSEVGGPVIPGGKREPPIPTIGPGPRHRVPVVAAGSLQARRVRS